MDLVKERSELRDLRKILADLEKDLRQVNSLLYFSKPTDRTYPYFINRRNLALSQISTFKLMIEISKDDLYTLSRT